MFAKQCLGLVLVVGLWASAASAVDKPLDTRFYIAPLASYGFFDDDVDSTGTLLDIDDGFGGQISLGKPIFSFLNLELQAFYFDGVDVNNSSEVDILGYGGSALLFPFRSTLPVFGILGYSYGNYDFDGGEPNADIYDIGVGYAHEINDYGIAIRGEYRFRQVDLDGGNGFDADFDDHIVSLGLQIPLGARPKAAPPPRATPRPAPAPAAPQDSDGDGVPDRRDQCPGTPPATPVNASGCPVEKKAPIVLKGVTFEFDSARLTNNASQRLNNVVNTLKGSPSINVRAEGHTDNIGGAAYNKRLSEERAASVKRYLVDHGISSLRLQTEGFGETRPVAPNTQSDGSDNPAGRAQNRRVELHVTE